MAVEIIADEDRQLQTSTGGVVTFTRVMQIEADSLMEIASDTKIPQRGWRHPENSAFYLDSIEITPNGNKNRRVQALATLVYNNSAELIKEFDEDPWDLGAQNFSSQYVSLPVAFITGYDQYGNVVQNLNSAGCRIAAETNKYIREIQFTYCVKAKNDDDNFEGVEEPLINKSREIIAGIDIKPLTGLILPQSASFITEYNQSGNTVKRRYWEISTVIQINQNGWSRDELDVGTMAYFKNANGNIVHSPRNIFSYTPWTSKDPAQNINVQQKFGSIDDVVRAKNNYAIAVSGYNPATTTNPTSQQMQMYQQAWDELPYSEVTEPMPLRADGTLYEEALSYPAVYPYNVIKIFDTKISSWNSFDLPKRRI